MAQLSFFIGFIGFKIAFYFLILHKRTTIYNTRLIIMPWLRCRKHHFSSHVSFSSVRLPTLRSCLYLEKINHVFVCVSISVEVNNKLISWLINYYKICRPTFWRIVKRGSTEEFESLPYICTLLNSSLWTYYGVMKAGEYLVATVNGFGVVVETTYLVLFLIYAPSKIRVSHQNPFI